MKNVFQSKIFPCACTLLLCILPSFAILERIVSWLITQCCAMQKCQNGSLSLSLVRVLCVGTTETCNLDIQEETD